MSRTKRFGAIAASAVVAASTLAGLSAAPASAAVTPNCASDVVLAVTSANYHFLWDGATWFHDGPGGNVTGLVQVQRQITASISVGADVSVNDLISSVKASVNATATRSVTTTLGHTYTHSIPATKYGNLQYGGWGYSVGWTYEYRHSNCTITVIQRGTGVVPTVATGWHYFTTNS